MQFLRPATLFCFALLVTPLLIPQADAQPVGLMGVFGDADVAFPWGGDPIAQGSVFMLAVGYVGSKFDRLPRMSATAFPLPYELAGASVRVTVGGVSTPIPILATHPFGIRALLPSGVPAGAGTIELTFKGRALPALYFEVVPRRFAVYQKLGSVQALNSDVGLIAPARPGQNVTLWGTGLGRVLSPVDSDEAAAPQPGALVLSIPEVAVGGIPARVLYAGRSGCCAGIDQIVIEIPPGVEGCYVPVAVSWPESDSPTVTIAIAAQGDACAERRGLSRAVLEKLDDGTAKIGQLRPWGGGFFAYGDAASEASLIAPGTCARSLSAAISPFSDIYDGFEDPPPYYAGPVLNFATPSGPIMATWFPVGYNSTIRNAIPMEGEYHVDNGAGGGGIGPFGNIGPFAANFTLPELAFIWSNKDNIGAMGRQEPVPIVWNAGPAQPAFVRMSGYLTNSPVGMPDFVCVERADKSNFLIPANLLQRSGIQSARTLKLTVEYIFDRVLDVGPTVDLLDFRYATLDIKSVEVR